MVRLEYNEGAIKPGMDAGERRAAILRAEQERAAQREAQLQAQSSPFSTPQERIRLWENLHALNLPRNPDHRLVRVIAAATALSAQDVHDEQLRRKEAQPIKAGE